MDDPDRLMATVCIKGGKEVQVSIEELADYLHNNAVSIEELADYLHNNADKIETRHLQRRGLRRRIEGSNDSNLPA
jgi:hypothetical protein